MAEGPRDVLVSRNSATTKYPYHFYTIPECDRHTHTDKQTKWTKVHQNFSGDATPQNLKQTQISSQSVKKCLKYPRSKICAPRKSVCPAPHMYCWTGVVTKIGPYGGQHAQAVLESDCESNEVR